MKEQKMEINVHSEIGKLEGVIVHKPGREVENMTPENAERALYSDILNLSVVDKEYDSFFRILKKFAKTFEVMDLLEDVLGNDEAKTKLLNRICALDNVDILFDHLNSLSPKELATQLIEGVPLIKDSYSRFLSEERYSLQPLHNFFFTRDTSVSINDRVLISKPASNVRYRESIIMETIFKYHSEIKARTFNPMREPIPNPKISIEGGDVLIAREDIIVVGNGIRTSTSGVDYIVEHFKNLGTKANIIVQELPHTPESFIHLDMVFTLLDQEYCMIYSPLVLKSNLFRTFSIKVDNGEIKSIKQKSNLLSALKIAGLDLKPIYCGGKDEWIQEREQWHSGTNFFAVEPGKVIGYERNVYTLEEMNKEGFEIVRAKDILNSKVKIADLNKCVISIWGSELSRGGGGARCMTMPINRQIVNW